jgi:DnaJ-class molecular chaperone
MNKAPKHTALYETLGVTVKAELDEIKKAFRKLALKLHPDKLVNASDEDKKRAEATFKDVTEAYAILSDPKKREQYDRFGIDAFKNGSQGQEMDEDEMREMFESMGMHFPFGNMGGFGIPGMGGMGGRRGQKREFTMPNIIHPINLNMKDIYLGSTIEFEIERCSLKKNANPKKEDLVCNDCKGVGSKVRLINMGRGMMQQSEQKCQKCVGEGIYFAEEFFDKKLQKFSRTMPKGIMNGEHITIENKGHEVPPCFKDKNTNNDRTNIILVISEQREYVLENYKYSRGVNNNPYNIALELDIDPHEAICGTYKYVPFINGKNICIKIPSGVAFKKGSCAVAIPKMGMPIHKQKDKYGDLYVVININDTFNLEESKLKQIWNLCTGKSMSAENDKIIKKANGEYITALTIDDFRKENELNGNHYNNNDGDDDSNEFGHGGGHSQGGGIPQCAQQ